LNKGFEYLLNAEFIIECLSTKNDLKWFVSPELTIRGVRRLTSGTFTSRFNRLEGSSCLINLWIGEQVNYFIYFLHLF
jgi:hypothetical protein